MLSVVADLVALHTGHMSIVTTAATAGLIAGLVWAAPAAAKPVVVGQLTIRTYNIVGAGPREIEKAHRTAASILGAAGIAIEWRDCDSPARLPISATPPCLDDLEPLEVIVRLIEATPQVESGIHGYAIVGRNITGSVATIYVDRVHSTATLTETDAGTLLGRALAHELGHILRGRPGHSERGLMRAPWFTDELRHEVSRDWLLSRGDSDLIRKRLTSHGEDPCR